jgi:hypothetical protein
MESSRDALSDAAPQNWNRVMTQVENGMGASEHCGEGRMTFERSESGLKLATLYVGER